MKGLVLRQFVEMVEDTYSDDVADRVITNAELPSEGVYTALGYYDAGEMQSLVSSLSTETQEPAEELVENFGVRLFSHFSENYPQFFDGVNDSLTFLRHVDDYIHVEVRKLYPDAELPVFEYEEPDADTLVMTYKSKNPFGKLAEGLIEGCIAHFNDRVQVTTEPVADDWSHVNFTLKRY